LDGGRWLRTAKFDEHVADGDNILCVDKKGANFGFSNGGHNILEDLADGVDGAVEAGLVVWCFCGIVGFIAEEKVATNAAGCFGFGYR
jgi:hypothetical protein